MTVSPVVRGASFVVGIAMAWAQTPAPAPEPACVVGGVSWTDARAVFDPFGSLRISGTDRDGARELVFTFPEIEPPPPGERQIGGESPLQLRCNGAVATGTAKIAAISATAVQMQGELRIGDAAAVPFSIALACTLAPAGIAGAPALPRPGADAVASKPVNEDLVFCALGNTGTGSDVQRRIGQAIARLAPTGPLDFVLLLGDNFLPRGVAKTSDVAWRRCFEEPYPDLQLPMAFHAVLGDRDHLGDIVAQNEYGRGNVRWDLPHFAYSFTHKAHGAEFLFVGIDTTKYSGSVREPPMRYVSRTMGAKIEASKAPFKIVFGHHSMHGGGPEGRATPAAAALRERTEVPFAKNGVTLYLAGGDHHLELLQPEGRPLEVISGTGGGLVRSATWSADTRFAAATPGFTWFRWDGKTLEISFRDADGNVLHVHRLAGPAAAGPGEAGK
ncbi:MAG: hypothetical protein IPK26_18040 [Planctomycetes bacterium]|nr:hypothetical protein [Planctomycetota bacterium]